MLTNPETEKNLKDVIADIKTNHHDFMVREMQKLRCDLHLLADQFSAREPYAALLAKFFEHFAVDFICHMDVEESLLFPWVLAEIGVSPTISKIEISAETLKQISNEDLLVEKHFARIKELVKLIINHIHSPEYQKIYSDLCFVELNLKEHIRKEQKYIIPFIRKKLILLQQKNILEQF